MDDAPPAGPPESEIYQSLYRRYRPQRFAEVLGQDHVTRALRNAVRDGRIAHAYLFSGPRGTGKTSTARILAMALNCEHPVDGEPDGTCPSCVEVRRGASMDVHELDAASNRKLEEMRDLLSRVALGTSGRWKVYIVDEVHQLTADAASALLKTLEEPPAHVVFVLATTDPQKVLPTIQSRTQHFEFRLLGPEVLAGLLRDVNDRAHLGVPPEAIDLVVRRGHGSARDALSVLDQVAAAGTFEDEAEVVSDIVDALAERDPARVLVAVAEAHAAGRDPRRLAAELLDHFRNGFLATQARGLVLLADDAAARAEEQARQLGLPALVRAMETIGQASVDMRDSVDPRVTLEVALVRLSAPAADTSPAAIVERLDRLERAFAERPAPPADQGGPPADRAAPVPAVGPPPGSAPGVRLPRPDPSGDRGDRRAPRPAAPDPRPPVGDPPPFPGRPALGAHRRLPAPPPPGDPGPAATGDRPDEAGGPPPSAPANAAPPPSAPVGSLPDRDQLTKAWGDQVLSGLRPGVKAYVSSGRFVRVDGDAAVFALPDRGLLGRAEPLQGEVEAALAAHFGVPVPLRLVVDDGPVPPPDGSATPVTSEYYDLDALEDAGPAVVSPEQRLLEAFPGAEEVTS